MPFAQKNQPNKPYAPTSKDLRKDEIAPLLSSITHIDDLKRIADSIVESTNFHLDARQVGNDWKVDLQYKKIGGPYAGKTVAVVMLSNQAQSLADFRAAMTAAIRDGHVYAVT